MMDDAGSHYNHQQYEKLSNNCQDIEEGSHDIMSGSQNLESSNYLSSHY